jgi:hypothetical protein
MKLLAFPQNSINTRSILLPNLLLQIPFPRSNKKNFYQETMSKNFIIAILFCVAISEGSSQSVVTNLNIQSVAVSGSFLGFMNFNFNGKCIADSHLVEFEFL